MRSSKSQKTAFLLSLFLGGFAADRFYLGWYTTAAFKLLTFGGLGIAYMADLFLILFGFLGPADGSLFPERL
jgi:TM2 domain-containing membrane protein YozV